MSGFLELQLTRHREKPAHQPLWDPAWLAAKKGAVNSISFFFLFAYYGTGHLEGKDLLLHICLENGTSGHTCDSLDF
jgi:hypothetical protein